MPQHKSASWRKACSILAENCLSGCGHRWHARGNRAHLAVAVLHARDELLEKVSCFILGKAACLHDSVEQLAARSIFHGNAEVRACQEHLLRAQQTLAVPQHDSSPHLNGASTRPFQQELAQRAMTPSAGPHLSEADYVGVEKRPVVDQLPLHILVDLRGQVPTVYNKTSRPQQPRRHTAVPRRRPFLAKRSPSPRAR